MDTSTKTSECLKAPNNMVKSWSISLYGLLFQLDDGSMWMHGRFPSIGIKEPNVPRTEPIKLTWNVDVNSKVYVDIEIIYSDWYIIFKN